MNSKRQDGDHLRDCNGDPCECGADPDRFQRTRDYAVSQRAEHCGGFRLVKGQMVEIHNRACRSSEGLCACPCAACKKALGCKHDGGTFFSFGSIAPFMPELRIEMGQGRAKREDGIDYVGPVVKFRRARPNEQTPKTVEWKSEICITCGMRLSGTKSEL